MYGFRRADVNTGLAVDAHVLVNLRFLVIYGYCRCRTFIHAGFTGCTFFFIDDCYQNPSLLHIYTTKDKKRVSIGTRRLLPLEPQDVVHTV